MAQINLKVFLLLNLYLWLAIDEEIRCFLNKPSAAPTPSSIRVTNFKNLLSGYKVTIHLPNIQNPYCLPLVTDDIVCPTNAHLTFKIIQIQNRKSFIYYQNDAADPVLILNPVLPQEVVKNPKNDDLTGGLSSNPTPIFSPNIINKASSTSVRYQPGVNKYVTGANSHMIFIFPLLPTTVP